MTLSEAQGSAILRQRSGLPPAPTGLPLLRSHHLLRMPCSLPRRIDLVLFRLNACFPTPGFPKFALAFPEQTAGRHPRFLFRGLLKLHSRYGLRICSPTYRGFGRNASTPVRSQLAPLLSYPGIPTTPGAGLSPAGDGPVKGARLFFDIYVFSGISRAKAYWSQPRPHCPRALRPPARSTNVGRNAAFPRR